MTVRLVVHSSVVRDQLLNGTATKRELLKGAEKMAAAAGEGVVARETHGRRRARVVVDTETVEAIVSESQDGTLSAAINAARR